MVLDDLVEAVRGKSAAAAGTGDPEQGFRAAFTQSCGLRPGITVADIAVFVRMTLSADSAKSRGKAIETILDGLTRTR